MTRRTLPPLRYLLLTLAGALAFALVGCAMAYMCADLLHNGVLPMRHGALRMSESPVMFTLMTLLAGLLGAGSLLLAVNMLRHLFAPAAARRALEARLPAIYGPTRPSLLWALGAVLALICYALLRSLFA